MHYMCGAGARRRSMIHGYWKSMEVYGSRWKPINSAPSARHPSLGDSHDRGKCEPISLTKPASSKSSQVKPSQASPSEAESSQEELASQLQASSSATVTPTARPTTTSQVIVTPPANTSQMRTPPNTSQMVNTSQMLTPRPPNLLARRHGPLTPRRGCSPDELVTPPVKPSQAKSSQVEQKPELKAGQESQGAKVASLALKPAIKPLIKFSRRRMSARSVARTVRFNI